MDRDNSHAITATILFSRDVHSSVLRYCVTLGARPAGRITVLTDGCLLQLTGRDPQVVGLSLPTSVAIRHAKVRTALAQKPIPCG